MDRELLKEALVKRARVNPSTYPISRFLTNPWTAAVGLGSLGAAAGPYAPIAIPALGAVGYGATKLKRWLKARALMSRGTREIATDQPTMMEFERDALYKILEGKKVQKAASEKTAKISPRVMKTLGQAFRETPDYPVMYPFSEIATSRAVKGGLSGGRAVAQSGSAEEAMVLGPLAAAVGGTREAINRAIYARSLAGRAARGGKGLGKMEKEVVEALQHFERTGRRRELAKKVLLGGAAAGGVTAAGYALAKKKGE